MSAWAYGPYKSPTRAWDDPRLGAALIAIKRELVYNGFGDGLIVENPVAGDAFKNRVSDFQRASGLTVDGQVGSKTALELFRKRVVAIEDAHGFPSGTLGKQLKLESAYDPVAVGVVDPDDHGIAQINLRIHSNVTVEQSFDPIFAIEWAADYIDAQDKAIINRVDVFKAARAAYNIGNEYASQWLLAGFPASGGPILGGQDSFARATQYIKLIDSQQW